MAPYCHHCLSCFSCLLAVIIAPTQGRESRSRRQRRPTRSAARPPPGGPSAADGPVVVGHVTSEFDSDDAGKIDGCVGVGVDAPHQRAVAGQRPIVDSRLAPEFGCHGLADPRRPVVDVGGHHHLAEKLAAAASRRKFADESAGSDGSQSTSSPTFLPSHAPTSEPARSGSG